MAYFSQDFIERVRAANDLTQVVAAYNVQLKRAGSNLVGLCPFHNEKTGSFNVRPAEQFFRCFGCGAKGSVFTFVQMIERVEFPEAVRMLAERAGLALEFDSPEIARKAAESSRVKEALLWCCSRALEYFEDSLAAPQGAPAREYLASRGFSKETIQTWRIGWAPESWDGLLNFLLKSAKEQTQKDKVVTYAHQAGLAKAKESDAPGGGRRYYDLFRGRVMFPILDSQRRPVAFGGRLLQEKPEAGGKYINSPEGRLFEKRKVLFGLSQASKEIALSGTAVVVEGYVDVIMSHQYGVKNVIATLGTALTEQHAAQLRNYVRGKGKVIAFFDADAAGRNATARALDVFMEHDVPLAVAPVLDGDAKDAGEFLPRFGAEAFREKLAQAEDGFAYLLRQTVGQAKGKDPVVQGDAIRQAMRTVNLCPDLIKRTLMRQQVAAEAGVPEETLPEPEAKPARAGMAGGAGGGLGREQNGGSGMPAARPGLSPSFAATNMQDALRAKAENWHRRELKILRYMWENPDWCARVADAYPPDEWRDKALSELAALVRDEWDAGRAPTGGGLSAREDDADITGCLAELAFPDTEPMSEKDLSQSLRRVLDINRDEKEQGLRTAIEKADKSGDEDAAMDFFVDRLRLKRGKSPQP